MSFGADWVAAEGCFGTSWLTKSLTGRMPDTIVASGLPPAIVEKIRNILTFLQEMNDVRELQHIPSWRAHQLSGDRKGTRSLTVTPNWRITFRIEPSEREIVALDFEDYH